MKNKCQRIFNVLSSRYQERQYLKQCQQKVLRQVNQRIQSELLNKWIQKFKQSKFTREQCEKRSIAMKQNVFDQIKRRVQCIKIVSLVRRKSMIEIKKQGFQLLIDNMRENRNSKLQIINAELRYLSTVQRKAFRSFQIIIMRKILLKQGEMNKVKQLEKKTLKGLILNVQRKKSFEYVSNQTSFNIQNRTFSKWQHKLQSYQQRKSLLCSILSHLRSSKISQSFVQWKRDTFFTRFCNVLYKHTFQLQDENLLQSCFSEWRRYKRHMKNKVQQKLTLETQHRGRVFKSVIGQWKHQSRDTLFRVKMQSLEKKRKSHGLNMIQEYAFRESKAEARGLVFERSRQKQVKSDFLQMWRIALDHSQRNRTIQEARDRYLARKAFQGLTINRLNKMEDKYQMLRVIQHFGDRRPELLLSFSKTFLNLNSEYCESRLCSTVLAKYVIEKWKNIKETLRIENAYNQQAEKLYLYSLFRKGFQAMREGANVISHKRSLKLSCFEFYNVGLAKKVVRSLLIYQGQKQNKRNLENRCMQYQQIRTYDTLSNHFLSWHLQERKISRLRSFQWEIKAKYGKDYLFKAFQALKNYTIRQQTNNFQHEHIYAYLQQSLIRRYFTHMRNKYLKQSKMRDIELKKTQIALQFHNHSVQQRVFTQLRMSCKDQRNKNKYSKLYTVFIAWKFFIKEKKLLNKYLTECNYSHHSQNRNNLHQKSVQHSRALVDIDVQTIKRRRSSKQERGTPTMGEGKQEISFMHKQKSQGSFYSANNENFNSINSPRESLSLSPKPRENSSSINQSSFMMKKSNAPRYSPFSNNQ